MTHQFVIQLLIAYTLVGAFIFTVAVTCLSLVGWVKFAEPKQQRRLFYILIVQVVVMCVAFFGGFIKFDPALVSEAAKVEVAPTTETTTKVIDNRSETIENNLSIEVMSVFNDGGQCREGYIEPPAGYTIDRTRPDPVTKQVRVTLGERTPSVELRQEGDRVFYRVCTEHGPWFNQWRSLISTDVTVHYRKQ